ncbi:ficolin-2-like [Pocillopora verrucosa]|uniref:ficolin-2-like n=1 Tax=Pocillopora verrucosa TaxID=203993 RepID=UPI0027979F2B|nr:ficolin-2-like [Pocillopora verrucosa]
MSRIFPCSFRIFLFIALVSESQTLAHPVTSFKANCAELFMAGNRTSGVYTIDPDGLGAFDVYCNQSTAGGGWAVIQRRLDGSVDFNRTWCDYKHGFGNKSGEHWLGLDKINRLTWRTKNKLRVDLEFETNQAIYKPYAEYDLFAVESELKNYSLIIGRMSSGDAKDSFDSNNHAQFSTIDKIKCNPNCTKSFGAWWFSNDPCTCGNSNLNGNYNQKNGLRWDNWGGTPDALITKAEMKIKPDCPGE